MPETSPITTDSGGVRVTDTDGPVGAFVAGVDASSGLSDGEAAAIRDALHARGVVVLRGQGLNEDAQVAFASHFCTPIPHPTNARDVGGRPEICIISNVTEDGKPVGALGNADVAFHADLAFRPVPGTVSVLYAVEVPDEGGDTMWAGGRAAWDALEAAQQERLRPLRVAYSHARADYLPETPAVHPLVATHPESGIEAFYFSANHAAAIEGMADAESAETIDFLKRHTTDARFTWTHRWQAGDLVMWDNRCTQHRRTSFDNAGRRLMRRVQSEGAVAG